MAQTAQNQNNTEQPVAQQEKTWPMVVQKLGEAVDMKPNEYWHIIKATCGLEKSPDTAVMAFLLTARKYELDPVVRQIYAFEKNGKIVPIVPIDGWLKIINDNPETDGIEFKDVFDDQKKIFSITCKIHRKDRKVPVEVTEYLAECSMDTQPWKKWPIRMLRHKATIQAARYAFGLGGIYDPDEGHRIIESEVIDPDNFADQHMAEIGHMEQDPTDQTRKQPDAVGEPNADADWTSVIDDQIMPGLNACKTKEEVEEFLDENGQMIGNMPPHTIKKIDEAVAKKIGQFTAKKGK